MKIAILGTGGVAHALGAGWKDEEIMDLSGIRTARGPEHYALLFFEIVAVMKSRLVNIHVTR
jgi:hypothetical protein